MVTGNGLQNRIGQLGDVRQNRWRQFDLSARLRQRRLVALLTNRFSWLLIDVALLPGQQLLLNNRRLLDVRRLLFQRSLLDVNNLIHDWLLNVLLLLHRLDRLLNVMNRLLFHHLLSHDRWLDDGLRCKIGQLFRQGL